MAPDIDKMLAEHDAGLLIGDPALQIDRSRYFTLDLAEEWIRYTGKPLSSPSGRFAKTRCKTQTRSPDLAACFNNPATTDSNPQASTRSPREWAPRLGISPADVRSYLTENIYYHLDAACLEGLQLFYRYAAEIGALPAAPEI